jgi:hypothetical protein
MGRSQMGSDRTWSQHDINATTGEEVFVFTIERSPDILK